MESQKNLDIFKLTFLDSLKEKNITGIVLHENNLIVGDDRGTISQYQISDTNIEKKTSISLSKKIEQLIYIPQIHIIYVNSANSLTILSSVLEEKLKGDKEIKDPIMKIASNEHRENVTDFLVITKKKKVKFFKFNHEVSKIIQQSSKSKEVIVPEIPELLSFYGKWICYFIESKQKIYFFDLSQGKEFNHEINTTCIKHIKGSWLTYTQGIGLLMDHEGPKSTNPFMFNMSAKFISFEQYNSYILSLHDSLLEVHDMNDSSQVQEINIETGSTEGKFLCVSQNKVLIVCQVKNGGEYRVWKLDELPYEDQIKTLLMNYQFEEALSILNNNINAQTETKPTQMEEFFVDCGWTYMKMLTKEGLEKAREYFHISNLDIFALVYMYINLLDVQPIHDSYKDKPTNLLKQTQFDILIKTEEAKAEKSKKQNDLITIEDALQFLINILQSKRQYYLKTYDCSKPTELDIQSCSFIHSVHSPVQLTDHKTVTVLNTIKMINCTLVKAYVKTNQAKFCAEIIDSDKFGTDYLKDGFLQKDDMKHNKMALAMIHENKGDYEQALAIWKTFAEDKCDPTVSRPARDRTIKILKSLKDPKHKQIYEQHISWMLPLFQEPSFEIILENQELLDIDYILEDLIPKIEEERGSEEQRLKERFLSFVNKKEKYVNEKLQTQLVLFYIDRLFKKHTKEDLSPLTDTIKKQYDELKEFIKVNNIYSKVEILEKINKSWMTDIEIYLFSQLGKFNEALHKLIELGKASEDFTEVMKFCKSNLYKEPLMYNDLFSKLCTEYQYALQMKDSKNQKNESLITFLKKEILDLLQRFIDNTLIDENDEHRKELEISRFQMLDPFRVLGEIPNDWKLSEDIIYTYFNLIMKEYSHMNHKYKIMKNCCEMDLLYKQIDLAEQRANYVLITNETVCGLCNKKIGNTLFTVYPNKKIYHSKCVANANPTVDPISKKDFTKDLA